MLAEFLDSLVGLIKKGQTSSVTALPNDPRTVLIDKPDGTFEYRPVPPGDRKHRVDTLADLIAAAQTDFAPKPTIWIGDAAVTLVTNIDDRRDVVVFQLKTAATFLFLQTLTKPDLLFTNRQLADILGRQLLGCGEYHDLIANLRKVRWNQNSETRSEFGPQRESLGKDVAAECTATIDFPEFVEVDSPVWDNIGEDREETFKVFIDVRAFDQKFGFSTVEGELLDALKKHKADIRERIEKAIPKVPVFFGTP